MNTKLNVRQLKALAVAATMSATILIPTGAIFASTSPDTVDYTITTDDYDLTTNSDDVMTVTVTIEFDQDVYLDGDAEDDFNITIAGSSLSTNNLTYEVTDSTEGDEYIEIVITDDSEQTEDDYGMFKACNLTITSADSTLSNIKAVDGDAAAVWDLSLKNQIIESGLELTSVYSSDGTAIYEVSDTCDIRCMTWLQLSCDGSVVSCTQQLNTMLNTTLTIPTWASGSFVIHSHNFATMTASDYATEIAAAINASTTIGLEDYSATANDEYVTITNTSGSGTISLDVYNYLDQ